MGSTLSGEESGFSAWEKAVLKRLDRIIDLLQEDKNEKAAQPPPTKPPPPKVVNIASRKPRVDQVAPATYKLVTMKIVQTVMGASDLGKLTTTLHHDLPCSDSTFSVILRKFVTEVSFLSVSDASRGQPRYVRITDRAAAQLWLEDKLTEPELKDG